MRFLNLLDTSGNISITNLAVIITLFKLVISPSASITEAGILLVTLSNYAHKRLINKQQSESSDKTNPLEEKISEMESKLTALSFQAGIKSL